MNKTKIDLLLEWEKRPEVDQMIADGVSANRITQWMNAQGFKISVPTVINYIKMRKGESVSKPKDKPMTDQEILDKIILKGYQNLDSIDRIRPDLLLKAIKLYEITQGRHDGLTVYGLNVIRLREEASLRPFIRSYWSIFPKINVMKSLPGLKRWKESFTNPWDWVRSTRGLSKWRKMRNKEVRIYASSVPSSNRICLRTHGDP
jgi:hypothetical protein